MDIVSSPKVGRSLPKTIMLVVRSIYPNLPHMGQNLYHIMLMPLHDSMPSFMNFRRVLDLLEFKNQASQCFAGNQRCPGVWNSFPFLAWDLSMHPRTHIWFSTNLIALEHAHVVQIWIMHINSLKIQLMHKNVQTNHEKSQKFTQHSCCSMLTREISLKAIRGNGCCFVPKGGTSPTENHHACCEKLRFVRSIYPNLPQMGQNLYHGMLMPLHDSMPSFI